LKVRTRQVKRNLQEKKDMEAPGLKTNVAVYRVDRFRMPKGARSEFLARVRAIHRTPRTMPGFIRDVLLEQGESGGKIAVLTMVEWKSADTMTQAKDTVASKYQEAGFDPRKFMERLGIEAEFGNYMELQP
jgi:heme-degrading monooxygenase HmoA